MKELSLAFITATLLSVGCILATCGCSVVEGVIPEGTDYKTKVVESTGFDGEASVQVMAKKAYAIGLRLFNLPIGPALVYWGPMEEIQETEPTK